MWTFGERAWGCLFGLYPWGCQFDKRLDVTSLFPLRCLKIVLAERLDCWFWKSPGLGLFASQEQENNNASCFLLAHPGRWLPGLPGGRYKRASGLSNVLHVPLESLTSFYARLCCSSNGATRRLPGQEGARQALRAQGQREVGLTPLGGRHSNWWALLWLLRKQKKSRAGSLCLLR